MGIEISIIFHPRCGRDEKGEVREEERARESVCMCVFVFMGVCAYI